MRTVFTNSEVAHVWARQKQKEGRDLFGFIFFEGPSIYSCGRHFEMARFIQGGRAVLFNNNTHLRSTIGKQRLVLEAIDRNKTTIVRVIEFPSGEVMPKHVARKNIDYHVSLICKEVEREKRAKLYSYEGLVLNRLIEFKRMVDALKLRQYLKKSERVYLQDNAYDILLEGYHDKIAARAEKRAERDRKEAEKYAERARLRALDAQEKLKEWREGANVSVYYADPIALRVKGDHIETTMGAKVPIDRSKELWALISHMVDTNQSWVRNGKTFEIGHYSVDRIDPDGTTKIGCHTLEFNEMKTVAQSLGWA